MRADDVKLWVTYVTAALIALMAVPLAVWVWIQPPVEGRDLALIFGFIGTAFGGASTFLFIGEQRTAQARATERAMGMSPAAAPSPYEDDAGDPVVPDGDGDFDGSLADERVPR